ncbi:hypothetical protein [Methanoregula sp.]|uniref:hypothetical protein n=1 Tax=Methanoregula sp. TaxID=2052170 RepID=UPI00356A1AB8
MKTHRLPPLVADIVKAAISAVDGVTFTNHSVCPVCGGPLIGYDTKRKQFAHLLTATGPKTVYVDVKRFYCRNCHGFCLADNPFYPDTRIGSVIIDLCIALSMTMPVNRVPAYLATMGINVDRSSCRLYVQNTSSYYVRNNLAYIETNTLLSVHLPRSVLLLSRMAIFADEENHIKDSDILAACGFPSAQRTGPNRRFPLEQWGKRENDGY